MLQLPIFTAFTIMLHGASRAAVGVRRAAGPCAGADASAGLSGTLQLLVRTLPVMPAHLYEAELEKSLQSAGAMVRWAITAVDDETVTAEVILLPHSRSAPPRSVPTTMSLSDGWMRTSGLQLVACAEHVVAAAAVLADAKSCDEEEPRALSACGCKLGKAGRSCEAAADSLDEGEWAAATAPLSNAARSLAAAAASLLKTSASEQSCQREELSVALAEAAAELEDASSVTGCISLAAAAGPSVSACGEALSVASLALGAYAEELNDGVTAAHAEAGAPLVDASACLREAGVAMAESGASLEHGNRPL